MVIQKDKNKIFLNCLYKYIFLWNKRGFFILLTPKNLYNKEISIVTIVARCQAGIFFELSARKFGKPPLNLSTVNNIF